MNFQHRNGETEPPTEEYAFYWYCNIDWINHTKGPGGIFLVCEGVALDANGNDTALENLPGQWWGPVTPPWEQEANP